MILIQDPTGKDVSGNETVPYLDGIIRGAQAAIEEKFLFRKLGLPFDYASSPDDFPSKFFATSREARTNQPNPSGLGGGYHFTARNHALLFESYLLRLELGIEGPGDEAILDRLIGGLIRLATVAPKSFLVGGLAPDGRGFFGAPRRENHAAWMFAVNRGLATAAISLDSQEKFRSIAGKWLDRIRRERFRLHGVDGKAVAGGDFSQPDAESGPLLLAMLLTAARLSGEERDWEAYAAAAEENGRARLGSFTPENGWGGRLAELMWRQCSWSTIFQLDREPARRDLARERMREHALAAAPHCSAWRKWDRSLMATPLDLDWRKCRAVSLEESPYGFVPPESWKRLDNESHLETSMNAGYILLLTGDSELAGDQAAELEECLRTVPWGECVALNALSGTIGVHGRGLELGLWDAGLYESMHVGPASETSYAAKYLEPSYDEKNLDKAGHRGTGGGKGKGRGGEVQAKAGGDGAARKRRKRKKARERQR